jgi:hypothetical protein
MKIFIEVLPRPCKCIVKLLRRSVENPWVRYSFFFNWRENKMEGGQGLYRTLGLSRDFPRVYAEPL